MLNFYIQPLSCPKELYILINLINYGPGNGVKIPHAEYISMVEDSLLEQPAEFKSVNFPDKVVPKRYPPLF
jgi:mannitol/fructose-specific phosphotransferase system IIA component (Ntr-type)